MTPWRFVPLCPDDLDAVITIETQSFDQPWRSPSISAELANLQSRAFILIRDKHDVGAYIFLRIVLDEAHILKLAVTPEQRGQGLAASLTDQALGEACREGCDRAILEVRASNLAAIRLYTQLGFKMIGERKRYYGPTGEDALVMAKILEEAS